MLCNFKIEETKSLSVNMSVQHSVLTEGESTVIRCTAHGEEVVNLTLWRGEEMLDQVNEEYLNYSTGPYPYGTYQCAVGNIQSMMSVLHERGKDLLLYVHFCCSTRYVSTS